MAFITTPLNGLALRPSPRLNMWRTGTKLNIDAARPTHVATPCTAVRATPRAVLQEGARAPTFSATDSDGEAVSLADFAGMKLVVYFSAGMGGGCTSQSRAFRDAASELRALDAKILAVSAQGKGASAAFKRSNELPFAVVPDADRALQKLFDVPATFGVVPGRITYVIDRDGVIRKAYNSQFDFKSHVKVAKEALSGIV